MNTTSRTLSTERTQCSTILPRKKVLHDLSTSAQKRNDKKRNNYVKRLHALNFCSVKMNAASSPDEVYDLTLGAMEEALGFSVRALDNASFVVVGDGKLKFVRQSGFAVPLGYEIPLNGSKKGITVRAALTQRPVLVPDVTKDKDSHRGNPYVPPARSELVVPVVFEGETLGVLSVEREKLNALARARIRKIFDSPE